MSTEFALLTRVESSKDGEDVLILIAESAKVRRWQLQFWKRHNNTYIPFRSSSERRAAGFLLDRVASSTENGGKFDAVISQAGTGRWFSGIKVERVKKGGKAA